MTPVPSVLDDALVRRGARRFARGELLVRPTDRHGTVWFLHEGLTRWFSVAEDGQEHVHAFPARGEWVHGALEDPATPGCCTMPALGVEALKPTLATGFEWGELDALRRQHVELASYLTEQVMSRVGERLGREAALATQSAEQRYRELVVRHPDLLHEVRRQDIAGWLGITPVAFSRLRRRVHGA